MIQDIAPKKFHNEYHPEIRPKSGDPVFHFRGRDVLISSEPEKPWPSFCEFQNEEQVVYIFSIDEQHYFMLLDRANRFCGSCGGKTEPDTVERAMKCKDCGRVIYPRINPAVIVGVTNGDKLLLTYYARNRGVQKIPALIAGFTEIGETFEECVAREVMEEVGLKVKNIRYYKSQPWGLADDILAGYYCDVDGDDTIHIDENELKKAEWVSRKDITGQPNPGSMTHEMMMWFKDHEV